MKGFTGYLKGIGNGENTIQQKKNYAGWFLSWLEAQNLPPEEAGYNDLLNFIDYSRLEAKSKRQINSILRTIRDYYCYLKQGHPNISNPATNLYLRGTVSKVPANIISILELEKLYMDYKAVSLREKRNKIILGLLIYQGITTEELQRLEAENMKLKEGKIYITGNRRRNSRILELKPFQILDIHEYITEIKPEILKGINRPAQGRKPHRINRERLKEQLFISVNGSENIKNSLLHMFKAIQKENAKIKSAKQIRRSVIVNWLKHYNLREVQYMAGHKYVSSTERYRLNNIDDLQSKLDKFHPLNDTK
jgi:integrase/recombinase XerD